MITADTSVVVAAFASWHEGHRAALAALVGVRRLPAQVLIESYSVLTRLPPPHRAPADVVATFLAQRFPPAPLALAPRAYVELIETASRAGIVGGAVYDALVASAARQAGATLLTRDQRASTVYGWVGVEYKLVA